MIFVPNFPNKESKLPVSWRKSPKDNDVKDEVNKFGIVPDIFLPIEFVIFLNFFL